MRYRRRHLEEQYVQLFEPFSLAGLVFDRSRAKLNPQTAESQILLKYWLRDDPRVASVLQTLGDDGDNLDENKALMEMLLYANEPEAPVEDEE